MNAIPQFTTMIRVHISIQAILIFNRIAFSHVMMEPLNVWSRDVPISQWHVSIRVLLQFTHTKIHNIYTIQMQTQNVKMLVMSRYRFANNIKIFPKLLTNLICASYIRLLIDSVN